MAPEWREKPATPSPHEDLEMPEARRSDRARALLGARIILNNHQSTIECQVRNISATGAKLVIANSISVPDEFEIQIPQKGRAFNAQVVWRTARETGVRFVPHPDDAIGESSDEAHRRIKSLETENARLKKKIADLQQRLEKWSESI
jgi:hypothetical protein